MFGPKQIDERGAKITSSAPGTCVISAQSLELKNLIGMPFSGVSLEVKQGQVFAVRGRNGSGKTALLLTLAGRMLFTSGKLIILGYRMPLRAGKVHRRIGLGLFEGLNDLPDSQTVRSAIAAEFELRGRRSKREDVDAFLDEWQLGDIADKRVGDLSSEDLAIFGVLLAWVGHPDIIAVDDIESNLTKSQSEGIMRKLLDMARERNVTILVGVLERDLAAMADAALYLEEDGSPMFVPDQRTGAPDPAPASDPAPAPSSADAPGPAPAPDPAPAPSSTDAGDQPNAATEAANQTDEALLQVKGA